MNGIGYKRLLVASVLALIAISGPLFTIRADEADTFFDDSYVHEVRIYFDFPDWYNLLYDSHANDPEDPYFPARFESQGVVLDPVGARFKGNSSFGINSVKKPIKVDFDEYDEENPDMTFFGLKKLSFSNGFKDPTFLREKMFLDFAARFGPTIRGVHTRVYINDIYWGLYTSIEQIDKTFVQLWYDENEDGNLFKAQASDDAGPQGDFGSDLTWLGWDPEPYHERYQLKTNEELDDYSQLIEFVNILNNYPSAQLPDSLEPVFDVYGALRNLALDNLFVNLDSYSGSAHNYYLYDRDDTGRLGHLHWDTNEAFGRFLMGLPPGEDPLELDPFWMPSPPPQQPDEERPLMENLWAVGEYSDYYLDFMRHMLQQGFDVDTMYDRVVELSDLIRADVYADANKMYSNAYFETNLTSNIYEGGPGGIIYGLRTFVLSRANYLRGILPALELPAALYINEVMASNNSTVQDDQGEFDDWVEIYNAEMVAVDLAGYYLSDGSEALWRIPTGEPALTTIPAGGFLLVWFDKDSEAGPLHIEARLDSDGEAVYLYAPDRIQRVDGCEFGRQYDDVSLSRIPDGAGDFRLTLTPTPGYSNQYIEVIPGCDDPEALNYNPDANVNDGSCIYDPVDLGLYLNEFLASNDTVLSDEVGEFDDWIEIVNLSAEPIELLGYGLTDDLGSPFSWTFPDTTIDAGEFLLVWADNDPEQGNLHTTFKLDADGEQIGLYTPYGAPLDTLSYLIQMTDISEGRLPDGTGEWMSCDTPTPGATNDSASETSAEDEWVSFDVRLFPNPSFGAPVTIDLYRSSDEPVRARIYDLQGRIVKNLPVAGGDNGSLRLTWRGDNESGRAAGGGIYFLRVDSGSRRLERRVVFLR